MNIFCFLFFSLSSLITMKMMSMMILITAIYCVFILCFYCVLGPVLNMFNLHKNTCWCQIGHLSSKCHIAQVRNLRLRLCNLPNTRKWWIWDKSPPMQLHILAQNRLIGIPLKGKIAFQEDESRNSRVSFLLVKEHQKFSPNSRRGEIDSASQ